jgi:hypothetical protein
VIDEDINERMARLVPQPGGIGETPSQIPLGISMTPTFERPNAAPDIDTDYADAARRIADSRRTQMMSSLVNITAVDPDSAARSQKLGSQFGVGGDLAARNAEELRQRAFIDSISGRDMLRRNPVLADYIAQRQFAEIAHDDVDALAKTEQEFSKGWFTRFVSEGIAGIGEGFGRAVAQEEMASIYERQRQRGGRLEVYEKAALDSYREEMAKGGERTGFLEEAAYIGSQQLTGAPRIIEAGMMGATAGGGLGLVGGPAGFATVPAGMATGFAAGLAAGAFENSRRLETAMLYGELQPELGHESADRIATTVGIFNAALDTGAAALIAKPFAGLLRGAVRQKVSEAIRQQTTRAALANAAKAYGIGVAGEVTTETVQELNNVIGSEIGRYLADKPMEIETEEGREAIATRLVDTFVATAMGMSIMGAPGPAGRLYVDTRAAKQGEQQAAKLQSMVKAIADNKLLARSPERLEEFAESAVEGTDSETTYVNAAVMHDILRQSGITEQEMDTVLPGVRAQLTEMQQNGIDLGNNDVTVPTAQMTVRLQKTPLLNQILPHARLSPDAMSITEVQQFEANREQLVAEARQIMETRQETDATFVSEAQAIEDRIFGEVTAAGIEGMDERAARANAQFVRDMYVTMAARMNVSPAEVERRFPYRVQGEVAPLEQADQFDQSGQRRTNTPAFRSWFGESKAVTETGTPLLMYRGAYEKIVEPRVMTSGGIFITPSRDLANAYGDEIMEVFVSVQKPLDVSQAKTMSLRQWKKFLATRGVDISEIVFDSSLGNKYSDPGVDQLAGGAETAGGTIRYNFYELLGENDRWKGDGNLREELQRQGFDGVISQPETASTVDTPQPVWIVWNGNQLKSPNNRGTFSRATANIMQQAATLDADYLAAVERGDMATAQRMVDEAAMASGYTIEAFHGTPKGGFTEFNDSPRGLFFTSKPSIAQGYTYFRNPWLSPSEDAAIYRTRLRMQNPLIIDADGRRHNNIPFPGREYRPTVFGNLPRGAVSVEEAARLAFEAGHDGLVIKNVMDSVLPEDRTRSTVYVVPAKEQAKLADPVTRDEQGNVVPLSRRFDITSPKLFEQAATAQLRQDDQFNMAGQRRTDTPEFRKWSREAPVVDEYSNETYDYKTGSPVVVFGHHGTPRFGFQQFEPSFRGERTGAESAKEGYFFSAGSLTATTYTRTQPTMRADARSAVRELETHVAALGPKLVELAKSDEDWKKSLDYLTGMYSVVNPASEFDLQFLKQEINKQSQYGAAGQELEYAYQLIELAYEFKYMKLGEFPEQLENQLVDLESQFPVPNDRAGSGVYRSWLRMTNPFVVDLRGGGYQETRFSKIIRDAKEQGYDSVIIKNAEDAWYEGIKDTIFVVFDNRQIKDADRNVGTYNETANMFEQAAPGPARGGFDPRRLTTILNKNADLSTFLHETAHFYLHVLGQMATDPAATPEIRADMDTLLSWFGIAGDTAEARLAAWNAMSIDQQRKYHEQFAYSFEVYLFDGKSPSVEMQGLFERFSSWLRRVYKSIRDDLNAIYRREFGEDLPILTGEVRQVMDRMLATEEQIKRQAAINEMKPQFQTLEQALASGMTEAEYAAYQVMQQEAMDAAVTDMTKASLRQMQWLGNARSRLLRDLQRKHDRQRKEVRDEVAEEIRLQPVYRAMEYLRTGTFVDSDGQSVKMDGPHRLDMEAVRNIYAGMPTPESLKAIRATGMAMPKNVAPDIAALGTGGKGMMGKDGIDPDVAAELFGYSSGDALIRALLAATPMKEAIDARTDEVMLARFSDLVDPKARDAAVQTALHNEARARFVAVELRFVAKATQPTRVLIEAARQAAREMIAGKRIVDVKPQEFIAAESRAARDAADLGKYEAQAKITGKAEYDRVRLAALSAGSTEEDAVRVAEEAQAAFVAARTAEREAEFKARFGASTVQQALIRAKRAQLYQNQLAAEALRVREEVDKGVKYLKQVLRDSNVKRMGADYADQIERILERFNLARLSAKARAERQSLVEWLAKLEQDGLVPDLAPEVIDEANRKPYQEMTVAEFRDLVEAVKQLEYIGKNAQKIKRAEEMAEFNEVRDEIVDSIKSNYTGKVTKPRTPTTAAGRRIAGMKRFLYSHLKAAAIARIFDGGKDDGPVWRYLIRTANAAGDMETRMRAEATKRLTEILAPVFKLGKMGGKGVYFPTIGQSLNREARLVIALNMGNDGNRQRLLDGEGWTLEQLTPVLESLTEAEWNAVQQVWDFLETYRPLIAAKERRLYGKEPNWVTPTPFTVRTADGKEVRLSGGYYPIKYDPVATERAETAEEAEAAKAQLRSAYTAATTRRSFTKARARQVRGRPLLYTMSGVYGGVNDVIHDLSWHEWLIQANRLMRDEKFSSTVRETYGVEAVRQLKDWIKDNAAGEQASQGAADQAVSILRRNVSAAGLGFNVVSAALQVTGFSQSIVRVGAKHIARGVALTVGSPIATFKAVNEKSSFMAERSRTQFRELNELRNMVQDESASGRRLRLGTYFLMMRMQRMVDVPTWVGAYEKALEAGKDEDTAVALADQAVIDSQGGGMLKDLSAAERGGPVSKLFTVFYSYMNTVYNMGAVSTMTPRSKGRLASDYLMLFVVPVVLNYALKNALTPDVDDEEPDLETIAKDLIAEELAFLMGMMVVVREFQNVANVVTGKETGARGYEGPAGLRGIGETMKFATQASQGEFDRAFRKSAVNMLGLATGLPSAQINRTLDGIEALAEGETENPFAPLTGVKR